MLSYGDPGQDLPDRPSSGSRHRISVLFAAVAVAVERAGRCGCSFFFSQYLAVVRDVTQRT